MFSAYQYLLAVERNAHCLYFVSGDDPRSRQTEAQLRARCDGRRPGSYQATTLPPPTGWNPPGTAGTYIDIYTGVFGDILMQQARSYSKKKMWRT